MKRLRRSGRRAATFPIEIVRYFIAIIAPVLVFVIADQVWNKISARAQSSAGSIDNLERRQAATNGADAMTWMFDHILVILVLVAVFGLIAVAVFIRRGGARGVQRV